MNTEKTRFNEYAIVDLGSNSFHMIIAKKTKNSIDILYKNKQNIHLATGLCSDLKLSKSSIERGINCLILFAERLKKFPVDHVKVVGTYALRIAKNKHQFLSEAAKVFPYPIEIISGPEEARLIYTGAIYNESVAKSDVKFIIDIGGGSTEIAIGTGSMPYFVESRPMGCVTYTKQFFPNKMITPKTFKKAKLAAEQQVEKMINLVKNQNISVAFGSSGTIKSIHHILLDIGVTDGIITLKRLDDLVSYVLNFKHFDDINFPSLTKERKAVFISGLAIFYAVFEAFGLEELYYTQSSLREGLLHEITSNTTGYQDTRKKTIKALSKKYHIDASHANQVAKTVKHFFSQWEKSTSIAIDNILISILHWSALLHEIGLSINFSGIHKHSAYILQHSNMPGFNEEQQTLLSTLVKYHRKSLKLENIPYFSLFEKKQIHTLLQILRLSVLINHQRITQLDLSVFTLSVLDDEPNNIELTIDKDFAYHHKLLLLDLEQEQHYWQHTQRWQLNIKIN